MLLWVVTGTVGKQTVAGWGGSLAAAVAHIGSAVWAVMSDDGSGLLSTSSSTTQGYWLTQLQQSHEEEHPTVSSLVSGVSLLLSQSHSASCLLLFHNVQSITKSCLIHLEHFPDLFMNGGKGYSYAGMSFRPACLEAINIHVNDVWQMDKKEDALSMMWSNNNITNGCNVYNGAESPPLNT